MMLRRRTLLTLAAAAAGCKRDSAPEGGGGAPGSGKRPRIAVVPKGTTHEFWKSVHAGAVKASREFGVDVIWKGPLKEDDLKAQIDVVETFVAQGVAGIVLAPLNDAALRGPVKASVAAKIPVVVFDSDLQGDEHASFVATDNVKAGRLAGEHLAGLLGGKGKVAVLRYQEASASTANRERGFLEAAREKGLEIISDNQYGGATTESAFATSENLLAAKRASAGGLDGVFAPNESTTFGMLLALRKASLAGKLKFVGFDASEKLVQALEGSHLDALVLQDPLNIGYLAVKTMAQHLRGEPVPKRIDTGATLVTRANMGEARARELLKPDLKPFLGELERHDGLMLSARGIGKAFGATKALTSVALEASAGEVHAIVGENGAGKSTLMKVLAGVVAPDEGTIELAGNPYSPKNPADARRRGVALVSQEIALCPHLDVAANVALGQEPSRFGIIDRARVEAATRAALAEVGAERIDPHARAGDLPLADRQLVEIARALVRWGDLPGAPPPARVLILDEPTSSLGREDTRRLFDLVRRLKSEGLLVLYISHFLEEISSIADRYTVLRDGRSVSSGAMRDVTPAELVEKMAGRGVEAAPDRPAREPGEVVLELSDLAGAKKPERANLVLRRGEIFGVAGLVGAGRTELLRAIFGLDPVKSGKVRVKAWAGPATPRERLAQGVGLLSEDRAHEGLALARSIAENVTLSKLGPLAPFQGVASRVAAALGLVSPARADEAAERWTSELGIKCRGPSQAAVELSGGNQQKLALARLLHHDVDVLLLDEPARGIDVGAKAQIFALIDALSRRGKAVVLVSSYLPELLSACDRIAVLCRGVLGEARPASSWTEHELLEHATGAAALRETTASAGGGA